RLLVLAIPLAAWPSAVQELARVTSPGGWVELVEASIAPKDLTPSGPVTQRLFTLGGQLAALRGIDSEGVVARSLDHYLSATGLINIERRQIEVPVGEWGGRLGSLMALNFREGAKALSAPIAHRFAITEQEIATAIEEMLQEFNRYHTKYSYIVAYGQKPY
ncbi:MAG: hypothetical protein IRZ31_20760, partial [Thermogemmatispora sp.]